MIIKWGGWFAAFLLLLTLLLRETPLRPVEESASAIAKPTVVEPITYSPPDTQVQLEPPRTAREKNLPIQVQNASSPAPSNAEDLPWATPDIRFGRIEGFLRDATGHGLGTVLCQMDEGKGGDTFSRQDGSYFFTLAPGHHYLRVGVPFAHSPHRDALEDAVNYSLSQTFDFTLDQNQTLRKDFLLNWKLVRVPYFFEENNTPIQPVDGRSLPFLSTFFGGSEPGNRRYSSDVVSADEKYLYYPCSYPIDQAEGLDLNVVEMEGGKYQLLTNRLTILNCETQQCIQLREKPRIRACIFMGGKPYLDWLDIYEIRNGSNLRVFDGYCDQHGCILWYDFPGIHQYIVTIRHISDPDERIERTIELPRFGDTQLTIEVP